MDSESPPAVSLRASPAPAGPFCQLSETLRSGQICSPLIEMSLRGFLKPPSPAMPACLPQGPRPLTALLSGWPALQGLRAWLGQPPPDGKLTATHAESGSPGVHTCAHTGL